jgi:hypothetical protein
VRGKLNGVEFRQTLVKYGGKVAVCTCNGEMLKSSGLKVGDEASVEIDLIRVPAK